VAEAAFLAIWTLLSATGQTQEGPNRRPSPEGWGCSAATGRGRSWTKPYVDALPEA
jgi:hypothetical protein